MRAFSIANEGDEPFHTILQELCQNYLADEFGLLRQNDEATLSRHPIFVQEVNNVLLREPQAVAISDVVVSIGRVKRKVTLKQLRRGLRFGSRLVTPFSFFTSGFWR